GCRPSRGDIDVRIGGPVSDLEEDPLLGITATPHKNPFTLQLLSVEDKMKFSFAPTLFGCFGIHHVVNAVVPDDDIACAVVSFWNDALEISVVDRMIFRERGQTLLCGIEAGPFRNCPGTKYTFHFEAEVIMQARRVMFLNDETVAVFLRDFAGRFRRFVEASFLFVFFETHELPDNTRMGRMRIKKKDVVIPFRDTLAYRTILVGA